MKSPRPGGLLSTTCCGITLRHTVSGTKTKKKNSRSLSPLLLLLLSIGSLPEHTKIHLLVILFILIFFGFTSNLQDSRIVGVNVSTRFTRSKFKEELLSTILTLKGFFSEKVHQFKGFFTFFRSILTTSIQLTFNIMGLISGGRSAGFAYTIASMVFLVIDFVVSLIFFVREVRRIQHERNRKRAVKSEGAELKKVDGGGGQGSQEKAEEEEEVIPFTEDFSVFTVLYGRWDVFLENFTIVPNIIFSLYDLRANELQGVSSVQGALGILVLVLFYVELLNNFGTHFIRITKDLCDNHHYGIAVGFAVRFAWFLLLIAAISVGFFYKLVDLGEDMYTVDQDIVLLFLMFVIGLLVAQVSNYFVNVPYYAFVQKARLSRFLDRYSAQDPELAASYKPSYVECLGAGMEGAFNIYKFLAAAPFCLYFMYQFQFFNLTDEFTRHAVTSIVWLTFIQGSLLGVITIFLLAIYIVTKITQVCVKVHPVVGIVVGLASIAAMFYLCTYLGAFFHFGPITPSNSTNVSSNTTNTTSPTAFEPCVSITTSFGCGDYRYGPSTFVCEGECVKTTEGYFSVPSGPIPTVDSVTFSLNDSSCANPSSFLTTFECWNLHPGNVSLTVIPWTANLGFVVYEGSEKWVMTLTPQNCTHISIVDNFEDVVLDFYATGGIFGDANLFVNFCYDPFCRNCVDSGVVSDNDNDERFSTTFMNTTFDMALYPLSTSEVTAVIPSLLSVVIATLVALSSAV